MQDYLPHQFFRLDFDHMLEEGRRQTSIHYYNKDEYEVLFDIHKYFDGTVLHLIKHNDIMFDITSEFVVHFAQEILDYMSNNGAQTLKTQQQLERINEQVTTFLAILYKEGKLRVSMENIDLPKASDFTSIVDINSLTASELKRLNILHHNASRQERLQIKTTLLSLAKIYEKALPPIMTVVKCALKLTATQGITSSDHMLRGLSEDLTFYEKYVQKEHPLFPVIGNLRVFYKVARNVENHHNNAEWNVDSNEIILLDNGSPIKVHIHEFQQKYRFLVWLYELGFRGIAYAFCEREKGELANQLVFDYLEHFPDSYSAQEHGRLILYPT